MMIHPGTVTSAVRLQYPGLSIGPWSPGEYIGMVESSKKKESAAGAVIMVITVDAIIAYV
jgi:hypothetical protein